MNRPLKELENYKQLSKKLEKFFIKELESYPKAVSIASVYLQNAGGKRLRPMILLLVSEMLGYKKRDRFNMAAVVETIHMASLIHDDVIDEADLRRGRETLNKRFGNHFSILVGDFLYAKAISKTLKVKDLKLMNLLSEATLKMIEGEIWSQKNLRNPELSQKDYIELIKKKTGWLFAASASIPAILSRKEEYFQGLFNFGINFGIFFQILDDTLDFVAKKEEAGKPVLHDLEEGKINLPVILLFDGLEKEEKLIKWIKESKKYKEKILKMVQENNTLGKALQIAKIYREKSLKAIQNIPGGIAKEILLSIPDKLLSNPAFKNL